MLLVLDYSIQGDCGFISYRFPGGSPQFLPKGLARILHETGAASVFKCLFKGALRRTVVTSLALQFAPARVLWFMHATARDPRALVQYAS